MPCAIPLLFSTVHCDPKVDQTRPDQTTRNLRFIEGIEKPNKILGLIEKISFVDLFVA